MEDCHSNWAPEARSGPDGPSELQEEAGLPTPWAPGENTPLLSWATLPVTRCLGSPRMLTHGARADAGCWPCFRSLGAAGHSDASLRWTGHLGLRGPDQELGWRNVLRAPAGHRHLGCQVLGQSEDPRWKGGRRVRRMERLEAKAEGPPSEHFLQSIGLLPWPKLKELSSVSSGQESPTVARIRREINKRPPPWEGRRQRDGAWPKSPPGPMLPPSPGKGPDHANFQSRAQQSNVFCETPCRGLKETKPNQPAQTNRPPGPPTVRCRKASEAPRRQFPWPSDR